MSLSMAYKSLALVFRHLITADKKYLFTTDRNEKACPSFSHTAILKCQRPNPFSQPPPLPNKKPPAACTTEGLGIKSLAVTYSHMRRPHTTIGAGAFHF